MLNKSGDWIYLALCEIEDELGTLDMAKNNLPIWCRENFSVRPELVEGWTEKFHTVAISGNYF
jgi:hypothetical protein